MIDKPLSLSLPVLLVIAAAAAVVRGQTPEGTSIGTANPKQLLTLDQIRDVSASERKAIQRLTLHEQQSMETQGTSAQRERLRQRLKDSVAGRTGPDAPIDIEESMTVAELNQKMELEVTRRVDKVASVVRVDVRDLRDLPRLIAEHDLSDRAASGLDQSRSVIFENSRHVLMSEGRDLAVVTPPDSSLEDELSFDRLGIVPPFVFSGDYHCEVVPAGDHAYSIIGRQSGRLVFEVKVDPQKSFRMLSRKHYEADGTTVGWSREYSTYQSFDGAWIPRQVVEQSARDGQANYRTIVYTTLSATINAHISDAAFAIPKNYKVQDIRPK
ncbi:MAG: hypothetical protein HS102_12680 [Planctomycetia bacterium]|nr:hypothetical protein [Planctomycetia bacterium]